MGAGRGKVTHTFGYLQMTLPRRVPHMLLDARANDILGISNLPRGVDRSQRLSLEGDFDQHFTLYAPAEYQTDALYVFTPDLMATLIDEGSSYDVELVDDRLYLYSAKPFRHDDPETMRWLLWFVELMMRRFGTRTFRYRDEKLEAPAPRGTVTPAGARLRARWREPLAPRLRDLLIYAVLVPALTVAVVLMPRLWG